MYFTPHRILNRWWIFLITLAFSNLATRPKLLQIGFYYTLYSGSTWFYLTQLHSTMALLCFTWIYYTLQWLCLALLGFTSLYYTLPWLYLAILESTTLYTLLDSSTLYLGSTWIPWVYLSPLKCTKGLLGSNIALLDTTWLYYTLHWLYLNWLDSIMAHLGFAWLYNTLLHSTIPLYLVPHYTLQWVYLVPLDSTTLYYMALLELTL